MSATIHFAPKHFRDLSEWSGATGVAVWSPAAGMNWTGGGIRVPLVGSQGLVTKTFAAVTGFYMSVETYFYQQDFAIESGANVKVIALLGNSGADEIASLSITNIGGVLYWSVSVIDDDTNSTGSNLLVNTTTWPARIGVFLQKASGASAEDGEAFLIVNGVLTANITGLDLYTTYAVDAVQVGRISASAEPTGTLYFDALAVKSSDATPGEVVGVYEQPANPPTLRTSNGLAPLYLPGRSGSVWAVNLTNAGGLQITTPKASPGTIALNQRARTVLDTDGTSRWRFDVDDRNTNRPIVVATALTSLHGDYGYELTAFSDNAREWKITVNGSGVISTTASSGRWPVKGQPIMKILDESGYVRFDVSDAGAVSFTEIPPSTGFLLDVFIRSQDNTTAYRYIPIRINGVVGVSEVEDAISAANIYYDYEATSPNGTVWRIQADENGVFQTFNVTAFESSRTSHTVALDGKGKLVVIDSRFKTATFHKSGWGGRTFRGGRA